MGRTMSGARYPSLYQINTRVWLTALSRSLGRPAILDDIPDTELDRLARKGFDWIWFLSVWQTGAAAQRVSRTNAGWRREFEETLIDLVDDDIPGSGFAVTGYTVHKELGGDAALARLRARMKQRSLKLMLDFVPNHMAPDHPWVEQHPDYFIRGTDQDLAREPQNYVRIQGKTGRQVFAYGRDPFFDGWPDTIQLDYANPALQEAMRGELLRIGGQCDGVRCDMAMLVLPDVFERTWRRRPEMFWPRAIEKVRARDPGFVFLAEVYWDLEWTLQQQGFNYAYDKRLYDRLREGHVRSIREHFVAGLDYQDRLARFLENHDELRAAATFPPGQHAAAAAITFLSPGLRFFHEGQMEGRLKRISPHLGRAPDEPVDAGLQTFYERLLGLLKHPVVRDGSWRLLECVPAWDGNGSHDSFVAFGWEIPGEPRLVVVVNYSPHASQCYLRLPYDDMARTNWRLRDELGSDVYDRQGSDMATRGLYLDMPAWGIAAYKFDQMP